MKSTLKNSLFFVLASLLTVLMSAFSLTSVLAHTKLVNSSRNGFLADKQRALNFYSVFSAAYDTLNSRLYTEQMRSEITAKIGSGSNLKVLDAGCGTGYTTKGILRRRNVVEVAAVDINAAQLRRAAKNLQSQKGRTVLNQADAENLPFQNSVFDIVISVGAIEYFPDPKKAIGEMARVAKPLGVVIVGSPERAWFCKFGLDRVFFTPTFEEVEAFFSNAGLENVSAVFTGLDAFFGTSKYVSVVTGSKAINSLVYGKPD
jgi:ubiquinone/menaquinone biosynthesis C-methylase UbiE